MSFLDLLLFAGWAIPVLIIGGFAIFAATIVERHQKSELIRANALSGRRPMAEQGPARHAKRLSPAHRHLAREKAFFAN